MLHFHQHLRTSLRGEALVLTMPRMLPWCTQAKKKCSWDWYGRSWAKEVGVVRCNVDSSWDSQGTRLGHNATMKQMMLPSCGCSFHLDSSRFMFRQQRHHPRSASVWLLCIRNDAWQAQSFDPWWGFFASIASAVAKESALSWSERGECMPWVQLAVWARALENDGSSVGSISLLVIFLDVRFFSKKRDLIRICRCFQLFKTVY